MQIISNKSNMLGEYYTPIELARFIVSIAFQELFRQIITTHSSKNIDNYKNWWKNPKSEYGNPLDEEEFKLIENAKILDLGIGNGIFLLNAARFFETITPNTEQQDLIKKRSDILKKNLFGVD